VSIAEKATKTVRFAALAGGVILAVWLLVAYTDWTVDHLESAGRGLWSAAKAVGQFFGGLARAITRN
jgi:hypothetical protein